MGAGVAGRAEFSSQHRFGVPVAAGRTAASGGAGLSGAPHMGPYQLPPSEPIFLAGTLFFLIKNLSQFQESESWFLEQVGA